MAVNFKTETDDTTMPDGAVLLGADTSTNIELAKYPLARIAAPMMKKALATLALYGGSTASLYVPVVDVNNDLIGRVTLDSLGIDVPSMAILAGTVAAVESGLDTAALNGSDATNFITNGDFATDSTGWTANEGAILTVSGGLMEVESAGLYASATQSIDLATPGTYEMSWSGSVTGTGGPPHIHVGSPASYNAYANYKTSTPFTFVTTVVDETVIIYLNSGGNTSGDASSYGSLVLSLT